MNKNLKMHFTKQAINLLFRFADKIVKPAAPKTPQTVMLQHIYNQMLRIYGREVQKNVFREHDGCSSDGNFLRLIRVCFSLISRLADADRYYRKWLGLAYILIEKEMKRLNMSATTIKAEMKVQWLEDIDTLPDSLIMEDQRGFTETVLSGDLCNPL